MDKQTAPLRRAYTLWAPFYDTLLGRDAFTRVRQRSLSLLNQWQGKKILLMGIGSGLDIPHLPFGADYTGIDITPAMLTRARNCAKKHQREIHLLPGNAMQLAFAEHEFDRVIMHLILAVVPQPERALQEAMRVLKPGGEILILDKFLQPAQKAPLRRALNVVTRNLATRTDVVFEDILAQCPGLSMEQNQAAMLHGWFRHIVLRKHPTSNE